MTDGDTIRVVRDGRREPVRYIGIDTPEAVMPAECFGDAARSANFELVAGERVRLVVGAEARDRYGRLLAYVYRASDGLFVNAELLRRGYARVLTIPPNLEHAREFRALARATRRAGRGLWSACR